MNDLNRREFVTAAVVSCTLCACGEFVSAAEAPKGPAGEKDAGPVSKYDKDGIFDEYRMAEKGGFIIIRDGGKIFALTSKCTHKGQTVRLKDNGIFCAGHKATFDKNGKVTKGPAKDPLVRYAIKLNDDKHVIVDVSTKIPADKTSEPNASIDVPQA